MRRRLPLTVIACAVAACVALTAADARPRLSVILVVDQMRADYVDRFLGDWTSGLKRLATQGARFTNAVYPYLATVTCVGHATIGSGALPVTHGIMQNAWFDRERGRLVACTDDASVRAVGYSADVQGDDSAAALRIPNFADEMRRQRGARVVSVSIKARSAIMLAGHAGTAVTWLAGALDGWQTSTAYTPTPIPEVQAFIAAHPVDADLGRTWNRLLPPGRYQHPDAGVAEAPPAGWTALFPHVLAGAGADRRPTAAFRAQWERSPFADAYVGAMAAALARSLKLGQGDQTDVLTVSFSTPDLVGHAFGPHSQEIQDIYAHLDRTIGTLLDALDALVGPGRYVVGLSADHGVTEIPEQLVEERHDGGRVRSATTAEAIERAARTALGAGDYVARVNGNDVYFAPGQYARLVDRPAALQAVLDAIARLPGVARVFRSEALREGASSSDPLLRAAALSYVPDRSGDLVIALKPGWMAAVAGTTHGGASPDDQRVPLMFFGAGIKAGVYADAVTPADLAPTLAAVNGMTLPSATGHALTQALQPVSNRSISTDRPR